MYIHDTTTQNMASVSAVVFAITTAIVCRCSNAWLVKRDGSEEPCMTSFRPCMTKFTDKVEVKPVTKPDGSLFFPANYFTILCGYLTTGSDCYGKLTLSDCEPGFQNHLKKNLKILSTNLCRNTNAMNPLVPCLNDKEFYEAYTRAIRYEGAEEDSGCNVAKEIIRRVLRVFRDRCGDAEYTSLKSVLVDFGDDLNSLFPDIEDQSCKLDISSLTPDRRKRRMPSSTLKGMMDVWTL